MGNWLMLVLSISLIQWHSIQFWMKATGEIGLLWSIAIEAAGLWLWWQRYKLLACTASVILIAGPMLGLALPMVDAITQNTANILQHGKRLAASERAIHQIESSLASYQLTSQTRTGWAARIDETQYDLSIANQRFDQLISDTPGPLNASKVVVIVSIEAVALLVLLLTQILTIGKLSNISKPATFIKPPPETVSGHQPVGSVGSASGDSTESQCIETLAQGIATRLEQALLDEGISQAEWARRNGVSAKNVSLLRNYIKRKNLGQELISKREMTRINKILP